jgi:hypothetical protein
MNCESMHDCVRILGMSLGKDLMRQYVNAQGNVA